MAVPTITSVTPSIGHTGGLGLVEIQGTGFQLWSIPPPSNAPSDDPWPTVEVLFGSSPGTDVAVLSATRLLVCAPATPLPGVKPAYGEGAVSVTVSNLDSTGAVIAGETVTAATAYTYKRQQLAHESDLSRLVRTLLQTMKTQIVPNVSITTHTDYDADASDLLDVVDVAELPSLVVFGPLIQENRFFSVNGRVARAVGGNALEQRRAPDTDDLMFTFVAVSDQKQEALNMQAAVKGFFKKNRWISLQRDPADASLGVAKYDLTLDAAGIAFTAGVDQKSNLRSFSGSFVVRGFDHEDLAGFPGDDVVGRTYVTEVVSITSSEKDG